jgi:disulfide bond formation protein DsbB
MDDPLEWLGQQFPVLFLSNGVCEEQGLAMLGLPLANWTLMAFAACLAVGTWALARENTGVRKP